VYNGATGHCPGVVNFFVAMWLQLFLEKRVGKCTSLGWAMDGLSDFQVHKSILGILVKKLVLFGNMVWE